MKLYLIRHAPAEEPSQTAPAVDDERALTEKGKARMVRTAAALKRLSVRPELILTSPLRRALETAALVAEGLGNIRVETLAELAPGTEASALSAAIRAHQALNELALVGHQPDLGRLAAFLIAGAPDACEVAIGKGGFAFVSGDFAALARFTLGWILPPQDAAPALVARSVVIARRSLATQLRINEVPKIRAETVTPNNNASAAIKGMTHLLRLHRNRE